jgi:hypothetical protein
MAWTEVAPNVRPEKILHLQAAASLTVLSPIATSPLMLSPKFGG